MFCGVIILILSNKSMSVPRSHLLAYLWSTTETPEPFVKYAQS